MPPAQSRRLQPVLSASETAAPPASVQKLRLLGWCLFSVIRHRGTETQRKTRHCKGLEEQGFIEWPGGDYVNITSAGIHAIESLGQPPPKAGGDTYHMKIGTVHGAVQQGSGNVQNVNITVTNNPEFDQAIAGLIQVNEASRLPDDEIEELRDEVSKLNRLALSEPKPGLLEKAKARIDLMKISFEGAKLLVQAAPYLHTAWEYFKAKHS